MELITGPKGRTYLKGTAPCGCTFNGRFYTTTNCTVLGDPQERTGREVTTHIASVERTQKRNLRSA